MPWAHVSTGTQSGGVTDTGFNLNIPAGSVGDDLIAIAAPRPVSLDPGTWNTPSGYTLLAYNDYWDNNGAPSLGMGVWRRKATGADTCTISSSNATINALGVMLRFSGGPAGALSAHLIAKNGQLAQQDINTVALTPVTLANCLILMLAARNWNDDAAGVTSFPGGFTTRFAFGSSFGFQEVSIIGGSLIQTTAANVSAGLIDLVSAASLANESMLIALGPAVSSSNPRGARTTSRPLNRPFGRG